MVFIPFVPTRTNRELAVQILPNLMYMARRKKKAKSMTKRRPAKRKKLTIQFLSHKDGRAKPHDIMWLTQKKIKHKLAKQRCRRRYSNPANIQTHDDDVANALQKAGFNERAIGRKQRKQFHCPNDMAAFPSSEKENEEIWERARVEAERLPPKGPPVEDVPDMDEIDPLCRPALGELWRKGYKTSFSCQGHPDDEDRSSRRKGIWAKSKQFR
jgi:hypothetical protein